MTSLAPSRPTPKRKAPRSEIWSSLLRQTHLAQARSRTHTLQHRALLLLGGSPTDQQDFVSQHLTRPPPSTPASAAGAKDDKRGSIRLRNKFAYGYGHVGLFSPPQQQGSGGSALFGGESEEVGRVECHCFAGAPEAGYEGVLRKVMVVETKKQTETVDELHGDDTVEGEEREERRPSVVILLSWRRPWEFLATLRTWFALLSRALLQAGAPVDEDPLEVLKEHGIHLTVVLQHVEAQEVLEREGYKDDTFDYISQCLRTCLLPLSAGLVYTPSAPAPTQPGAPLSEIQKILYSSLDLDIASLQPRAGARPGSSSGTQQKAKDELLPRHNVVDRMAIVVPSGWDSVGKIRLLSETFSPEQVTDGWAADLQRAASLFRAVTQTPHEDHTPPSAEETEHDSSLHVLQANGGAPEQYSSQPSPEPTSPLDSEPPLSPSKLPKSAISAYEQLILDPKAHKVPKPPHLEVTTKPEQEFLAEMRAQMSHFEAQDSERARREGTNGDNAKGVYASAAGSSQSRDSIAGSSGAALNGLGDVSFNVGGVSYNAEAAIDRLKRPVQVSSPGAEASSPSVTTPRTTTPRPPRREGKEETPLETDKLEAYFHSLMKRGGGASTPSKAPPAT